MTANLVSGARRAASLLAVACLFIAAAPADTIRVPGDQPTIQAGIDAAVNGDLVLIADGVYTGTGNKNLDFGGKAITVRGENGRDNCIIDCEQDGRAFYFHSGEGADSVVEGLTIQNGAVETDGGAILCESASPTILNCVLANNRAVRWGGGGGLASFSGNPTVTDCTFSGNTARGEFGSAPGGGMYNVDSSPTVTNCTFSGNSADYEGGGMVNFDSSPLVTNCTFIGNSAGVGGGICNLRSSPSVTNCTFTTNAVTSCGGGGMFNFIDSNPTVTNCTFSGNSADASGGGMYNWRRSSPTVTNCTFRRNVAGSRGGAIFNFRDCSPSLTNCRFTSNTADFEGGGMYNLSGSSPTMTNCTISRNSAGSSGGGMFNWFSNPTMANCTFADNTTGGAGGGLYNTRSSPTLTNCTFGGNSTVAGGLGAGMYNEWGSSSPMVTNCILWNDAPDEIVDVLGAVTTVRFSDVRGGWPGEGNIDLDPRFVDLANGDLHLLPDSPAIDAGDPDFVPAPGETDIDGQKRIWNARVDMGADEFGSFAFGDLNCDGRFDALDIEPFIVALFEPAAYPTRYPACELLLGDINGDQSVDALDIELFIDLLFGA